jgi:hypothetical protein
MRTISVGLVTALAAVGLGPAAGASPVPARRAPVLRGKTVVVADRTSVATVRIPIETDPFEWDIRLHGRGRVRGLVVTQRGESTWDTPTFFTVSPGHCHTAGCGQPETERGWSFLTGRGDLPAGEYRLFLIADGAPMQANIAIPGLTGSTRIALTEPAAADVDSFRTRALATPDGMVYTGGGFSEMGGDTRGLALMEMWGYRERTEAYPYGWGLCLYWERSHPAPDHAFAPGCPGGQPDAWHVGADRGYALAMSAFDRLPFGMGGYSVMPLTSNAGGVGLWMPLREALP